MSAFLSFVGGASRQFVSSVDQAELDAKEMAKASFKTLTERYKENAEANRKLTNEMNAEKQYIETVWPNATPEQVNELVANPVALEAIKKAKNPQSVNLNNYIQVIKGNESKAIGAERAAALPEITQKVKEAMQPTKGGSPIGRFIRDIGNERFETDMQRQALGSGMTLDQLRSAEKAKRPTGSATFDMGVLQEPKEFKELKDQAQVDLLNAKESNDPKAVNSASEKLARINTIEEIGKVQKKTEAQIQSDLVTEIQEKQKANDKQGAATATALLRQRQALMKSSADGKTDADKISQSNLIQVATRTRATTIEQQLPPGQLITNTDAQGNVTMTLRDLSQGDLFRRGDAIAANAIIKEMTKPDGTPRSEMHKNAMMSAGIRFDDAGKAIKPIVPELPTKGTPTPSAAAPNVGATTRPTVNVDQARADANAAIARGADRAAVAARFKQTTGQEL
jgi:iron-sulfur cluster repair protein YtfE (RIC family)